MIERHMSEDDNNVLHLKITYLSLFISRKYNTMQYYICKLYPPKKETHTVKLVNFSPRP